MGIYSPNKNHLKMDQINQTYAQAFRTGVQLTYDQAVATINNYFDGWEENLRASLIKATAVRDRGETFVMRESRGVLDLYGEGDKNYFNSPIVGIFPDEAVALLKAIDV